MTPNILVVLPDLVLAGKLKALIPEDTNATVGFASSQEDGVLALHDYTYLDLCIFCQSYPDGDGSVLIAAVREKFPRARLVVITDLTPEDCVKHDPSWVPLNLPLNLFQFASLCRETCSSMEGRELGHFQIGVRFRSDSWGDWYQAYDTSLKRNVDLGVLHSWATPEQTKRFREAAVLRAQAFHDHVQTVFFGGEQTGRSFVSHEKWNMPNLITLAEAGEKIDARIAARILHTVASVLWFWDENQLSHPPLNASQVTLSPLGVVKVENSVDPALPFKPMQPADLVSIANAVHALLPPLEQVPYRLRGLLNKLRSSEQVVFETSLGDIDVMLEGAKAPITVANFLNYVDRQAYDETLIHHIISGFVVQGGHYTRDMSEIQTDSPIANEASNGLLNKRGTIAMAHGADPNSAASQFILNLVSNPTLNPSATNAGFAVFGKIVKGLDVLDKMAQVEVIHEDKYYSPVVPVIIFRVRRKASITVKEVITEAQSIDMHQKDSADGQHARPDNAWMRAMTSTDNALASMSKMIFKLSGSLNKITSNLSKKDK